MPVPVAPFSCSFLHAATTRLTWRGCGHQAEWVYWSSVPWPPPLACREIGRSVPNFPHPPYGCTHAISMVIPGRDDTGKLSRAISPEWWWQVENGQFGREKMNTFAIV